MTSTIEILKATIAELNEREWWLRSLRERLEKVLESVPPAPGQMPTPVDLESIRAIPIVGRRMANLFTRSGIRTYEQLLSSEPSKLGLRNIGDTTFREIVQQVRKAGLQVERNWALKFARAISHGNVSRTLRLALGDGKP